MTRAGWMRTLPNGKQVSALGFGCSSLWAKPAFDEERAQDILRVASDGGINLFDTSPSYGEGLGEARLARFIKGRDRDAFVVCTKVGNNLVDGRVQHGFDRALIERSFLASLDRLGVDHVDVLYLHGPPAEVVERDEVLRFFEDQKAAGRLTYAAVESGSTEVVEKVATLPFDVVMPHFNVANGHLADLVDRLAAAGKVVLTGTVLAQMKFALSTFVPSGRGSLWYLLRILKNDPLVWLRGPALARDLRRTGRSPREAAIAFVVNNPSVTAGLFGSSSAEHVAENARTARDILATMH